LAYQQGGYPDITPEFTEYSSIYISWDVGLAKAFLIAGNNNHRVTRQTSEIPVVFCNLHRSAGVVESKTSETTPTRKLGRSEEMQAAEKLSRK
jgi:hypothetical protein